MCFQIGCWFIMISAKTCRKPTRFRIYFSSIFLVTIALASAPQLDHSAEELIRNMERPCAMTPEICTLGHDALLVRFASEASEAATACVQVMLRLIDEADLPNVTEIAPALASVMVRFKGGTDVRSLLYQYLTDLIGKTDWSTVSIPAAKRRWIIPVCFDGDAAPHLAEVAQIASKSEAAIIYDLENADVRVLALGFAPGQPYIGLLPQEWDMPRTSTLTAEVPAGALVDLLPQKPTPPFYCVQGTPCNFHAHPQMTLHDYRHQGILKGARYVSPFDRNHSCDGWPVYSGYGAHWHNRNWPVTRWRDG
ncbi:MAG: carboxyltransferase domain-containing protein [Rhodobacteraceae bacterium]|nr:carboxyltransferase domain-containing protein [Paracoccaceae bacterium]